MCMRISLPCLRCVKCMRMHAWHDLASYIQIANANNACRKWLYLLAYWERLLCNYTMHASVACIWFGHGICEKTRTLRMIVLWSPKIWIQECLAVRMRISRIRTAEGKHVLVINAVLQETRHPIFIQRIIVVESWTNDIAGEGSQNIYVDAYGLCNTETLAFCATLLKANGAPTSVMRSMPSKTSRMFFVQQKCCLRNLLLYCWTSLEPVFFFLKLVVQERHGWMLLAPLQFHPMRKPSQSAISCDCEGICIQRLPNISWE